MKKIIFFIAILFSYSFINAQGVICVQHGTTAIFTERLDSAVSKAQNGDYIYLPGGLIAVNNSANIYISKKLNIIGCGYHPDSSLATDMTQIPATIHFNSGSDSSQLTGVYLTLDMSINASNITIARCNLGGITFPNTNNLLFSENIIRGNFDGDENLNVTFQKNILYGTFYQTNVTGGVTFNNNIFAKLNSWTLSGVSQCLFQNNIFLHATSAFNNFTGNNIYSNNLFVADATVISGSGSGNIFNQNITNIFVNYASGAAWSKLQNFHLKPGCPAIGLGTDGTDAGIYGTNSPFKEGGIPFNPHYQSTNIPNAINASGMLNINITVKAQNQ